MREKLHRLERIISDLEEERLMIYQQLKQNNNKINAIENQKKNLAKQLTRNALTMKETKRRVAALKVELETNRKEAYHAFMG